MIGGRNYGRTPPRAAIGGVCFAAPDPCCRMNVRRMGLRCVPICCFLAIGGCGAVEDQPDRAADRFDPAATGTAAETLLGRSVAFHDPTGVWGRRGVAVTWMGTDSAGQERVALDISLDPDGSTFSMSGRYAG